MAVYIKPIYSVYTDAINGYLIGIHKIRLSAKQLKANAVYKWDVHRLASSEVVGTHLALEGQYPELSSGVYSSSDGGVNRNIASVYICAAVSKTYPKNHDGSLDLIYVTFHKGAINNSVRND